MEKLNTYNNSLQECFSSIRSIEAKMVEEKLMLWSSSIFSELTYSNMRQCLVTVGRSLDPKNIENKLLFWSSSVSSYVEEHPIIFSVSIGDRFGESETQTYVNLPYLGAVSLDTFLFSSSAILSRAYMFWRNRQLSQIAKDDTFDDDGGTTCFPASPRSPPVKATIVMGYKDKSLYRTIQECQNVRRALRPVEDPEVVRKEKKRQLALQNVRCEIKGRDSTSDGYLGMSPESLQDARKVLRQVQSDRMKIQRATE